METQEVTSLKQVLSWYKAHQRKEEHPAAPCDVQPKVDIDAPAGMAVLPHKDKDEFLVAPTAKRKSHKHHKSKKAASHAVTHDAISIKLFASLNLEIPSTPEDY